ncbi:MAG TPA: radical SAM protein [Bryobacteraceae bacterium]|nr:radical SAM protein [Bryobacteraceae bacterium]
MLFPELAPERHLIGIAKLASEGELLEAKRRVEYRELPTRRFIGRASGRKMPFEWTINPYRGCEFGCKYCYARYTHEFMELRDTEQFETEIYAKSFDAAAFRRELTRIPMKDGICVGTATDPYQPAERRFRITRQILATFLHERGRTFSLTTKSDLVSRDAELLGSIAKHNVLHVFVTVTTTDETLARQIEPYAPRPALRIEAIERLTAKGVRVVVLCSPIMPLINDSLANLTAVGKAVKAAGAIYMMGGVLFLKPCAQKAFYPFLEAQFPTLLRRYRERYDSSAFLTGQYPEKMADRVKQVRERLGLTAKPDGYQPEQWMAQPQLPLFQLPS